MGKVHCTNISCSMKEMQVETKSKTCLNCGKDLTNPTKDLFDRLFGGDKNPFDGLFG